MLTTLNHLTGTAYIRYATSEILVGLDVLGIIPTSVRVDLYKDGEPSEACVWFRTYDDAWAYAQLLSLPTVSRFNGNSDTDLIWFGNSYDDRSSVVLAGTPLRVRLVATVERPERQKAAPVQPEG